MDAHQNNQFGKSLLIFGMVFVFVFFGYVTFFHPHSSPDTINNLKDKVVKDKQDQAEAAPAAEATK
jgi:hypothetical protein